MSNKIYIGRVVDDDFQVDCDVDVDSFIVADQEQMPTSLAEGINIAIAFQDAVCRDLALTDVCVGVYPAANEHGDLLAELSLLDYSGPEEMSVYDSALLVAYLTCANVSYNITDPQSDVSVSTRPTAIPNVELVTVTANNDVAGDIIDKTQAQLLIKLDPGSPRWELAAVGSYDIDSGKFISVDGVEEIKIDAE